jgi:Mg2+/Co2+ transporter CorB
MAEFPWFVDALIVVFLLMCSAFFSGSETGLTAFSREKMFGLSKQGKVGAKKALYLYEHKESLLSTFLLGNTLVNAASASFATLLALQLFGEGGVAIATVAITLLVLIFGEVLPKTFAIQHPEKVAMRVASPMSFFLKLFHPITSFVNFIITILMRLLGLHGSHEIALSGSDMIRGAIELQHSEGGVEGHHKYMLGAVLDLDEVVISDVMIHRKQLEMLDADLPVAEMLAQIQQSTHSRIPFWRNNPDNIIGLLHVRDVMSLALDKGVRNVSAQMVLEKLTPPWFVPETTPLREQLFAFRQQRKHFAHVVDEYGAFLGIITLEDIIEEIVGEIEDEYDCTRTTGIEPHEQGGYTIDGTVTIRDINRHLDWNLPEDEASTIAGLVIHHARCIPELGAEFIFFGYRFRIKKKKANQILRVRVQKISDHTAHT